MNNTETAIEQFEEDYNVEVPMFFDLDDIEDDEEAIYAYLEECHENGCFTTCQNL